MNARNLKTTVTAVALGIAAAASTSSASAQGLGGIAAANAAFDAQFNARLGAMQQQTNANIQAIWMRHLQVNGPRLRAQYQQLVASGRAVGTFEQFAYWDLMSASGTNNAGALAAQRAQFEGNQRAYQTVQQGYASYNAGWYQNQAAQSAALAPCAFIDAFTASSSA